LKKKSPLLIVVSVMGNWFIIFNISTVLIFFQMFADAQNHCYYQKQRWENVID